jgi:hypothetical protein
MKRTPDPNQGCDLNAACAQYCGFRSVSQPCTWPQSHRSARFPGPAPRAR